MKPKLYLILSIGVISIAFGDNVVGTSMQVVKARNESQIRLVSSNFGTIQAQNKSDISQINMESAQASNKIKINNLKVGGSDMPQIDSSKLVANKIDINTLLKQAQQQIGSNPNNTDVSLYLSFTTLDKETVMLYSGQAIKYKIPIVLRGFIKNSYKETSTFIRDLRSLYPELTIMIDPPAFEKYDVTEIPALVVTKSPNNPLVDGCNSPGDFSKVAGEVSVQAMLDYVRLNSKNQILVAAATQRLNDVREKRYFKVD